MMTKVFLDLLLDVRLKFSSAKILCFLLFFIKRICLVGQSMSLANLRQGRMTFLILCNEQIKEKIIGNKMKFHRCVGQ